MRVLSLIALQKDSLGGKVCSAVLDRESRNLGTFVQRGVRDIHVAIGGKVRIQRQTQQSLFGGTVGVQSDNGIGKYCSAPVDQNGPRLLCYVDITVRGKGKRHGLLQTMCQLRLSEAGRKLVDREVIGAGGRAPGGNDSDGSGGGSVGHGGGDLAAGAIHREGGRAYSVEVDSCCSR